MKDPRFREAELEYLRIKQALASGHLTTEQAERALAALMVQHDGRYWMLGANSARWYVWDGQRWCETEAPETRQAAGPGAAAFPPAAAPAQTPIAAAPPAMPNPMPPVAPQKTPLGKYVLGCLMGCLSPLLVIVGVALIARTVMDGAFDSEMGMTFIAAGVFLFATCLVLLLPKIPLPAFLALYAAWAIAGFLAMRFGLFRSFRYMFAADNLLATGIVGFVGALIGGGIRRLLRPKG
jgi:hypothetical protein